jgi:hypothetical protein
MLTFVCFNKFGLAYHRVGAGAGAALNLCGSTTLILKGQLRKIMDLRFSSNCPPKMLISLKTVKNKEKHDFYLDFHFQPLDG